MKKKKKPLLKYNMKNVFLRVVPSDAYEQATCYQWKAWVYIIQNIFVCVYIYIYIYIYIYTVYVIYRHTNIYNQIYNENILYTIHIAEIYKKLSWIKITKNNTAIIIKRSLCYFCSNAGQVKQIALANCARVKLFVKNAIIIKILWAMTFVTHHA